MLRLYIVKSGYAADLDGILILLARGLKLFALLLELLALLSEGGDPFAFGLGSLKTGSDGRFGCSVLALQLIKRGLALQQTSFDVFKPLC